MSEKNLNELSEKDFDLFLKNSIEPPADEVVKDITPWRRAVKCILSGFALTVITLNFLYLNIILPVIGIILSFYGYRMLRKENGYFKAGLILTVIEAFYRVFILALNATVYNGEIAKEGRIFFILVATFFGVVSILCLCGGIFGVCQKAGQPVSYKNSVALLVWYIAVMVLSLINYNGLIVPVALIVAFVFIIRSLYKLSKELEDAGYSVETAPVRVDSKWFAVGFVALIVVSAVGANLAFGKYPMEWTAEKPSQSTEVQAVKEELIEKGFPKEIINDITDEDILQCKEATNVYAKHVDYSMTKAEGGNSFDDMRMSEIIAELPGGRYKVFYHFYWTEKPVFYGTEGIMVLPYYWDPSEDGRRVKAYANVSGRVMYDKESVVYSAPYHAIEGFKTDSEWLGMKNSYDDIYFDFSMPNGGEHYRGYVSYGFKTVSPYYDEIAVSSEIKYIHQKRPYYPVFTATGQMKQHRSACAELKGGFTVAHTNNLINLERPLGNGNGR